MTKKTPAVDTKKTPAVDKKKTPAVDTKKASAVDTKKVSSVDTNNGRPFKLGEEDPSIAELEYRDKLVSVELKELQVRRDALALEEKRLALLAKTDGLAYISVAQSEFGRAISRVYDGLKTLPEKLTQTAALTPFQESVVFQTVEALLVELSEINLNLSATEDVDKRIAGATAHASKDGVISTLVERGNL